MTNILIVCMGNVCRSPAAKIILNHLNNLNYKHEMSFDSAGILNLPGKPMDKRSIKFLNENGIKNFFHSSSTLNEKKASWADLIYFFDFEIYDHLIKKFPKHKNKFQLFGKKNNGLIINDPINVSKKDYAFIMKNVYTSAHLNLKSFNK